MKIGWVYILECNDGTFYTGVTSQINERIAEHLEGTGSFYASTRLPVKLVFSLDFASMIEAISAEKQIKGWSKAKKEALIRKDFDLLHYLAECKNKSSHKFR